MGEGRALCREGQAGWLGCPLPSLPPTPLPDFTPQFQVFTVFPPPLFLSLFLTAGTDFIYTSREPGAELHVLDSASCASAPSAQDGGRFDPPARAPA